MSLSSGSRLGPYEILSPLGAGGMGEVYRARDTTLNREVALKVLPDAFNLDPDRLARFKREAQVLASLNHPNIAAIYGFEASGHVQALVLELVDGPTLAERIAQGPIPLDDALPIARQIAEALEAAHEQSIIHRDLKPANIKLRPDGAVKVLDFGLAKALESAPGMRSDVTASPTVTTPAMTGMGVMLGTAAYMSPEQAKARSADKRSDLWAFGCVLYEMLTGKRAFEGEDVTDTLAAILRGEPDWTALPANVPAAVRTVLRRCLEKDRKARLADISTALFVVNEPTILAPSASVSPAAAKVHWAAPWRRVAAFTAVAVAAGAIVGAAVWFATRPAARRVTRFTITASGRAALTIGGNEPDLAIAPDGSRVVYAGNNGRQLFVRTLDALEPLAIATGEALRGPFVSPDGQWVGFADNNNLVLTKVAISGGPAIPLAPLDGALRGATWLPDDTIVFATANPATGLQRISANGGTPTVLTRPDHARGEADHLWPEALPGGRAVLFTIRAQTGGLDAAQIAVLDLRTHTSTTLLGGGSHGHYVASGHLVYTAAGTLRAMLFDLSQLGVRGPAVPVVPRVVTTDGGAGDFGVASDGTLVYVDAPSGGTGRTLVWVDRRGKEEPIAAEARAYAQPRISPDGTRVALYCADQENDICIWDLRRETLRRFTFDPGVDQTPIWTPDGQRIVFGSLKDAGVSNLWWQAADGAGAAERLTTSSNAQFPTGISPDGTQLVFVEQTATMGRDLMLLSLDGSHRVTPLLQTRFDERNGNVSPDGHWLAYESNSSRQLDIYVRPFPNAEGVQWQISTTGGTRPLWSPRTGKELFYVAADGALMKVPVDASGAAWSAGTPMKLLEGRYFTGGSNVSRSYDISPDGQRFLMIKEAGTDATEPPSIIVVEHWDEELKRLVPRK
jgi:Tol biopolymer transport system component